ncbi:hypothetical protein HPB47_015009 [Ixodes persulcatus]|uniref:Uncharacterized protein n=1 Tax=Ixodes persulcatus TaxID=34615 RepID=A0AC60QUJ6_IXOPE|nr:hypothetical protein HPB47_015009 [Ixodes persulcatus]
MLIPDIWFGHTKPKRGPLSEPFTKELQELAAGFSYVRDGRTVKKGLFAVVCSVDSAARAAYPSLDPTPEQRSDEARTLKAEEGTPGRPANGVKGPSLIMKLPGFNPIDGFIPDYQPCICLGVMLQLLKM